MSAQLDNANTSVTKEVDNPALSATEMIPTSAGQETVFQNEVEGRQQESKVVGATAKAHDNPVSMTVPDFESSVEDAFKGTEHVELADQLEHTAAPLPDLVAAQVPSNSEKQVGEGITASDGDEGPDGNFNRFSKLPVELRIQVIQDGFDDYEIETYKLYFGATGCRLNFGPLPLLLATKETRSVGLKYLDILRDNSGAIKLNSDGLSKAFRGIYTQCLVHPEDKQGTLIDVGLHSHEDPNEWGFRRTMWRLELWSTDAISNDMPRFSVPYMNPSLAKLLDNLTSLVLNFTPFAQNFLCVEWMEKAGMKPQEMENEEMEMRWYDPAAWELVMGFYPMLLDQMRNFRTLELLVPENSAAFGRQHVSYHDLMSTFDSNRHVVWETGLVPFKVKVAQIRAGIKGEIKAEVQAELRKLSAEDPLVLRLQSPSTAISGLAKTMQPQDTILKTRTNVQDRVRADIETKWWDKWTEAYSPDDLYFFDRALQENAHGWWNDRAEEYPTITLVTRPLSGGV